jgi:TolB protein
MDELFPVEPVRPPSPARRRLFVVVTLILVAAFVVVAVLEGSGFVIWSGPPPAVEATTAPSTPARLAYVDLEGALNVMDASSHSILRLPSTGVTFGFPAWSPDATRLAAIRADVGGTGLDVFAFAGGAATADASPTPTTVYASADEPVFYLYWAPDSQALAFLTTVPDGLALRLAPADVAGAARVIRNGSPMYWQWVDPTRLLVHAGGNDPGAFAGEVGLDGQPVGSSVIDAGPFRAPARSNDGRYLAFTTSGPDGSQSVVIVSTDGSARHDVAVDGVAAFEFDPAGDTLAFTASDRPGDTASIPIGPLRAIDPTTGTVRTLIDGSVVTFFWAPDGKTIATISLRQPGDTKTAASEHAITLARTGQRAIETEAGVQLRLSFVDVASETLRSVADIRLSDLFINQVLPYFDQYALSHRFWSPDSRSIVLPVDNDQGVTRLTTFFVAGSDPIELVDGQFATWSP